MDVTRRRRVFADRRPVQRRFQRRQTDPEVRRGAGRPQRSVTGTSRSFLTRGGGIARLEQVQRGLDLREQALDFLALVRSGTALQSLHERLLPRKQVCDSRHIAPPHVWHLQGSWCGRDELASPGSAMSFPSPSRFLPGTISPAAAAGRPPTSGRRGRAADRRRNRSRRSALRLWRPRRARASSPARSVGKASGLDAAATFGFPASISVVPLPGGHKRSLDVSLIDHRRSAFGDVVGWRHGRVLQRLRAAGARSGGEGRPVHQAAAS